MMKSAMRESRRHSFPFRRCPLTSLLRVFVPLAVVRKVNDLLRKLESMGCEDYRQQLEFQQLDSVITSFQ